MHISFAGLMDALTAPRAYKRPESASQNKMRGLGIEESDSKGNADTALGHRREAPKPRGKYLEGKWAKSGMIYGSIVAFRGDEVRGHNRGVVAAGERIPESAEETAEGIGVSEKEASEGEINRPEATLRCDRENDQGEKVRIPPRVSFL